MQIAVLRIKTAKGNPAGRVEKLNLVAGYGIEGDAGAGKDNRQVSLLSSKAAGAGESSGFCNLKFTSNLEIDGLEISALSVGKQLRIGNAVIGIESVGKECYIGCELLSRTGPCSLASESAFACVIETGTVFIGQMVTLI